MKYKQSNELTDRQIQLLTMSRSCAQDHVKSMWSIIDTRMTTELDELTLDEGLSTHFNAGVLFVVTLLAHIQRVSGNDNLRSTATNKMIEGFMDAVKLGMKAEFEMRMKAMH